MAHPKPDGSPGGAQSQSGASGDNTPLGANSVGTAQLQADAVTAAKLGPNAVLERNIKNGVITRNKLGFDIGLYDGLMPLGLCPEGWVDGYSYRCPANTSEAPNDNECVVFVVGNTALAFDTELGVSYTHDLTAFSWGSSENANPSAIANNRLDSAGNSSTGYLVTSSTLISAGTTLASLVPSVSAGGFVARKYGGKVVITNGNEIYEASTTDLTTWTSGKEIAVNNRGSIPTGLVATAMDKNFAGAPSGLTGYSIALCGATETSLLYLDGTTWKLYISNVTLRGVTRTTWSEADPIALRDVTLTNYTFKTSVGGVSAGQISFPSSAGNTRFFGVAKSGDEILFARFFRPDYKLVIQKDANNYIDFIVQSVTVTSGIFQAVASVIQEVGTIAADDTVSLRSHGANPDWSDITNVITDSDTLIPTAKSLRNATHTHMVRGAQSSNVSSFASGGSFTAMNYQTTDLYLPIGTSLVEVFRNGVDNVGSGSADQIGLVFKIQARYRTSKTGSYGSWTDLNSGKQGINSNNAIISMNKLSSGSSNNNTHHRDVSLPISNMYTFTLTQERWYQFRCSIAQASTHFPTIGASYGGEIIAIAEYPLSVIIP